MSDAIINSVELSPAIPTVVSAAPSLVQAVPSTDSAANDTPKPGSRAAKRAEREAKRKAKKAERDAQEKVKADARAKIDDARDKATEAEKAARQTTREVEKAKTEAAQLTKKKGPALRSDSSPEAWRQAFQAAATQASAVDDPFVAKVLADAERASRAFERDLTEQPATEAKLTSLKSARDQLYAVFVEDQRLLTNGLKAVRGGDDFVRAARADDKVATARLFVARMTPQHLGHNKHLFEAMKESLRAFEAVDQDYSDVKEASDQASTRIADGKRLMQLAVKALVEVVATAQSHQALLAEYQAQAKRRHAEDQAD